VVARTVGDCLIHPPQGASTRLAAGGGVGLAFAKNHDPATADNSNSHLGIFIPVEIGVEHFFTRWFAMGISARFNLLDVWKQGDHYALAIEAGNTEYQGSLFFYTD
jgi:hypothetical protein